MSHIFTTASRKSPCLCGSNQDLQNCCLQADGTLLMKMPSIIPKPPKTLYSHPKCYFNHTIDCDHKKSAEHYISRNILKLMGNSVKVSGLPWFSHEMVLSSGSIKSNILCKRHNESLSPLDAMAGKLFRSIQMILSKTTEQTVHLVSGDMIEAWMVKLVVGLYAAKGARTRIDYEHYSVNMQIVEDAMFHGKWHQGCGLYFDPQSTLEPKSPAFAIDFKFREETKLLFGACISFYGLTFHLVFDAMGYELDGSGLTWRPTSFNFLTKSRKQHMLILTWKTTTAVKPKMSFMGS